MTLFLDSFWRAAAYCLHPRVIFLSFLPLLVMIALAVGLGYFYWDPVLQWVRSLLESSILFNEVWNWLEAMGAGKVKMVAGPLIVIFAVTPLIIVGSLLLVAVLMTPALVNVVAARRYPQLWRKKGASFIGSVVYALTATAMAFGLLVASMPLWLLPPLFMVLPPLIWGWLNARMFAFDALADHASSEEREQLMQTHRYRFWAMGVISGFLGTLPSVLWAFGVLWVVLAPVLLPLAMWVYTLVFAFSALWFVHFSLEALHQLRSTTVQPPSPTPLATSTANTLEVVTAPPPALPHNDVPSNSSTS